MWAEQQQGAVLGARTQRKEADLQCVPLARLKTDALHRAEELPCLSAWAGTHIHTRFNSSWAAFLLLIIKVK